MIRMIYITIVMLLTVSPDVVIMDQVSTPIPLLRIFRKKVIKRNSILLNIDILN